MTIERKTLESDEAVRSATFNGVITFLLLRQGAFQTAREKGLPDAETIEQARDSARNELIYRHSVALRDKPTGVGLVHLIHAIGSIGLAIDADYVVPENSLKVDEIVMEALGGNRKHEQVEKPAAPAHDPQAGSEAKHG